MSEKDAGCRMVNNFIQSVELSDISEE